MSLRASADPIASRHTVTIVHAFRVKKIGDDVPTISGIEKIELNSKLLRIVAENL